MARPPVLSTVSEAAASLTDPSVVAYQAADADAAIAGHVAPLAVAPVIVPARL